MAGYQNFSLYPRGLVRLAEVNRASLIEPMVLPAPPEKKPPNKPPKPRNFRVTVMEAAKRFEETGETRGFYGVRVIHPACREYMDNSAVLGDAKRNLFEFALNADDVNRRHKTGGKPNTASFTGMCTSYKRIAIQVANEALELLKAGKIS